MRYISNTFTIIITKLTSVLLLLIILFSVLRPVNAYAQAATGVGGFTSCDYSSIEKNPKDGSKLFEACIRQVITFLFVVGLFLIVFRIGLSAFNSINPGADGNAIKDSVGAVRDIMIGLLLIIAPSIILATVNPAALSLNFLDLGKLASNIGGNNSSTTPTTGTNSPSQPNTNGGNTVTPGIKDSAGNTLPSQIKNTADLDAALKYYKANPTSADAKKSLKEFLTKDQYCDLLFVLTDQSAECNDINSTNAALITEVAKEIGVNPPLEQPSNYNGIVRNTTDIQTISSAKDGEDQILVIKYAPALNDLGVSLYYQSTIKISGCAVDPKLTVPGNILKFGNLITTEKSCNLKIISTSAAK
jgi:hypothetical protein